MKNRYPLPLIKALPSWSKCQFRQEKVRFLDLPRPHLDAQERAHRRTHQLARPRLWLSMMGLMMVVVAVVIPTGSSLPGVRGIQPCCVDIQVFTQCLLTFHPRLQMDSSTTYLNVKDDWIIRLSSKRVGNR